MPKVASYTVVRDTDITLPDGNDIDVDLTTFSLPNLATSTADADRPVLSFKVNPHEDDARVVLYLNDPDQSEPPLFAQTYSAGPIRTVTEVIGRDKVEPSGNTMSVKLDGDGSFTISDVVITYKANV
ncbi:MAG TPA: hypothetical protein VFX51_26255 [Solirubrobacteraceae bacterium]|nr:hypothetical protein [Solirubrobacteraceae bacterium]